MWNSGVRNVWDAHVRLEVVVQVAFIGYTAVVELFNVFHYVLLSKMSKLVGVGYLAVFNRLQ